MMHACTGACARCNRHKSCSSSFAFLPCLLPPVVDTCLFEQSSGTCTIQAPFAKSTRTENVKEHSTEFTHEVRFTWENSNMSSEALEELFLLLGN